MMKKGISLILAALLVAACPAAAFAETVKHERVYAVTEADGSVTTLIDSVYLENGDALAELTDRTALTDIVNVSGHETFTLDGETLTWQAGGADIRYQGTGTAAPAVTPTVTYTLDGKEIAASEVSAASGRLTIDVTYALTGDAPCAVVSVIPVPDGAENLTLENAVLVNEGTARMIVGLAVLGLDESLDMPASFTVACDASQADFSWMMTFASAQPLQLLADSLREQVHTDDTDSLLADAVEVLTAMSAGEALPEVDGELAETVSTVNQLLDGTASLAEGAAQVKDGSASLAEGAAQVKDGSASLAEGAAQVRDGSASLAAGAAQVKDGSAQVQTGAANLYAGITQLTANNDALNAGAAQIFAAVLNSANESLAASGLSALGLEIPALTADNYAQVLDGVTAQLQAAAAANPAAAAAVESLTAVKAQLDSVSSFVTGLAAYTAGVSQAEAGASQLCDGTDSLAAGAAQVSEGADTLSAGAAQVSEGADTLSAGAAQVSEGADTLSAGAAQLSEGADTLSAGLRAGLADMAAKYLPMVQTDAAGALSSYEAFLSAADTAESYDLTADGMRFDTVYIIRTVLN